MLRLLFETNLRSQINIGRNQMARKKKNEQELANAREIKKMELAHKAEAAKLAPRPEAKPEAKSVSFDIWWMGFIRKVKIRPSYKEIIIADFKARGLSMEEKEEAYNKAIESFGFKLPL